MHGVQALFGEAVGGTVRRDAFGSRHLEDHQHCVVNSAHFGE
jgi:hypothetical protein